MRLTKIVSIAALALSFSAQATMIVADTSLWTESLSPSSNKNSNNDSWVRLLANTPTKLSNSSGALISDISTTGNFTFSGTFSPTYAFTASCEAENTCDDDDILGLVFGWQDASNHYRLGWSQGDGSNASGMKDITGKTGLFLVKEENGDSNTIEHWNSDFWTENVDYTFSVSRFDDVISLMVEGIMQNFAGLQSGILPATPVVGSAFKTINFSIVDTTFTSGNVGIYTESQTAEFKKLSVKIAAPIVNVSAPSIYALVFLSGLALLGHRNRSNNSAGV
jgi:hypothetical protein